MPNSQVNGEAMNNGELLMYIAISTVKTKGRQRFHLLKKWGARCRSESYELSFCVFDIMIMRLAQ